MCYLPPPPPSRLPFCLSVLFSFLSILLWNDRPRPAPCRPTQVYNNGVPNMDDLATLHEASILDNIELRFRMDRIYTNSGPILIAMNPFKWLPIYGENVIKSVSPNPL
jgi:myosin heavy subunit